MLDWHSWQYDFLLKQVCYYCSSVSSPSYYYYYYYTPVIVTIWGKVGNSGADVWVYNLSIVLAVSGKCQGYNFESKLWIRMLTRLEKYFKE